MDNREALLERLTYLLAFRVVSLAPPEYWQIPVLKWQLEIEMRLLELEKLNLPEDEYQEAVKLAFCEELENWQQDNLDRDLTDEEYAWWVWFGIELGVINEGTRRRLIELLAQQGAYKTTADLKSQRAELQHAALLLDPPKLNIAQIPPGHNFWYTLGISDAGQWHAKDGLTRLITWNKRQKGLGDVFLRLLANKDFARGWSKDKFDYLPEDADEFIAEGQVSIGARTWAKSVYSEDANPSKRVFQYRDEPNQLFANQSEERVRLIKKFKPRELDLYNAELERSEAKKTGEQWYGTDKAPKVTQRMKYLKAKYSKS